MKTYEFTQMKMDRHSLSLHKLERQTQLSENNLTTLPKQNVKLSINHSSTLKCPEASEKYFASERIYLIFSLSSNSLLLFFLFVDELLSTTPIAAPDETV